jgi:hypothetical protein
MTISTTVVKHPRFASFEDYLAYTDNCQAIAVSIPKYSDLLDC